jgi:hypothetical protein
MAFILNCVASQLRFTNDFGYWLTPRVEQGLDPIRRASIRNDLPAGLTCADSDWAVPVESTIDQQAI